MESEKVTRKKIKKALNLPLILAYKKAVKNGSYKKQRDEMLHQILMFPMETLRFNLSLKFLKEHTV